jgi:lipopolysaccharide biosynthesis glycosyltransferase
MLTVFVGYDPKEAIAYHTCVNSIIRHSSRPIAVVPLALNTLNGYTEQHTDGSNSFTYSRFLVPQLMNYTGWALFLDGDMIVRDDLYKLFELQDKQYAAMVVKHDYQSKAPVKYFGTKNENYPCKNWSSVVLWNCSHTDNKQLDYKFVEQATGQQLHRFGWTNNVGELPIEWNWLPDEYGINEDAKLIHYTLGTPCFKEFANTPMAEYWHKEYNALQI